MSIINEHKIINYYTINLKKDNTKTIDNIYKII